MIDAPNWQRIETREQFVGRFADRKMHGDGMTFTIHTTGKMTGDIGGRHLSGEWTWKDSMFCRHAELDGEDLGVDCEIIEHSGNLMRYTRDEGRGLSSIVTLRFPDAVE